MADVDRTMTVLREHLPELRDKFHVARVAVFGSYARGDQEDASDIDLLVELSASLGWEFVDLHRYLEKLLAVRVNLLTVNAVKRKPLLWRSIQEDLIRV